MEIVIADLKLWLDRPENDPARVQEIADLLFNRFGLAGGARECTIETINQKFMVFCVRFSAHPQTKLEHVDKWLQEQGFTGFEINPPFG